MRKKTSIFLGLVGLAIVNMLVGCAATYTRPPGPSAATLVSHMDNDSTGTTLRTFWTSTSRDPDCKDSARLQNKLGPGDSFTSPPVEIEAGGRFVVSSTYMDARFGQNRECTAMVEFAPRLGRMYQVELNVRNDVRNCAVGVYDATSGIASKERVPFELPAYACKDTVKMQTNGRPLWLNHRYQIQTVPMPDSHNADKGARLRT